MAQVDESITNSSQGPEETFVPLETRPDVITSIFRLAPFIVMAAIAAVASIVTVLLMKRRHKIIFIALGPLVFLFSTNAAYAQDMTDLTPEIIQQCDALGIEPEKCSELEILKTRGGHLPVVPSEESLVSTSWLVIAIMAAVLRGAGSVFVLKLVRGRTNQKKL